MIIRTIGSNKKYNTLEPFFFQIKYILLKVKILSEGILSTYSEDQNGS